MALALSPCRGRCDATDTSAEGELALLLAGTRARREAASARIVSLAARVDEAAFAAFLVEQRMLLLIGSRLLELAPLALSDDFRARLASAQEDARAGSLLFATAGRYLTDALERAGIPATELKGAALAADLHGDEALRVYADVDVLVPAHALDDAVAVARKLGWDAPPVAPSDVLPELHRWLGRPDGTLPAIELHWRIHWYETAFAGAALARSRGGAGTRRLEPIDQFAALLLFYARDGFAGLRLAADIAAWWDRHGDRESGAGLERLIADHPALAEAWRASLLAVAPVAGLPAEALPASASRRGRRAALACRLRNWDLRGDVDQIKANVTLVDGLLTPQSGLAEFARRHLLVPTSYLTEVYGVAPDASASASSWRAWHVGKTAVRYALALWGLRGGRSWSPVPASAARIPTSTPRG